MALLSVKLKNRIKKVHPSGFDFHLKNTSINGEKVGCSGFIENVFTHKIVYVDTEKSCFQPLSDLNLYRNVDSLKDDTGKRNRWAKDSDLVECLVTLLINDDLS